MTSQEKDFECASSFIGTINSSNNIYSVSRYPDELCEDITLNHCHKLKINVDSGADTCIFMSDKMQRQPVKPQIKNTHIKLKTYWGVLISNI